MTTKVRQYDLKSGWEKWKKGSKLTPTGNTKYFILVGPKGVLLSYSDEGVHWIKESVKETWDVPLGQPEEVIKTGKRILHLSVKGSLDVPIEDIIKDCDFTEHEAKDMVRVFGSRLDMNWRYLRKNMEKIGLNLKEYDMSRRETHGL